jgi:hypothetical protein
VINVPERLKASDFYSGSKELGDKLIGNYVKLIGFKKNSYGACIADKYELVSDDSTLVAKPIDPLGPKRFPLPSEKTQRERELMFDGNLKVKKLTLLYKADYLTVDTVNEGLNVKCNSSVNLVFPNLGRSLKFFRKFVRNEENTYEKLEDRTRIVSLSSPAEIETADIFYSDDRCTMVYR